MSYRKYHNNIILSSKIYFHISSIDCSPWSIIKKHNYVVYLRVMSDSMHICHLWCFSFVWCWHCYYKVSILTMQENWKLHLQYYHSEEKNTCKSHKNIKYSMPILLVLTHGRNIIVNGTKKTACNCTLYRF